MEKLIIFILILFSVNSYGCDCKTISKEKEYKNSDLIFLGKITSVNSKYFEVEVLEFFKGKTQLKIKSFKDNCSISPKKGDVWLIYSNINNNFYISSCGNSRSFRNPFNPNSSNFPKPKSQISKNLFELISTTDYNMALLELNADITNLRLIKTQKELNNIQINYKNLENNFINLKKQVAIFKWILFLSIVIIVFIVFIKYRIRLNEYLITKITRIRNRDSQL